MVIFSDGSDCQIPRRVGKARDTYMEAAGLLASDPKFHTTLMLNCVAANIKLSTRLKVFYYEQCQLIIPIEIWEEVLCATSEVLEVDPKSVKALFRSARALTELKNLDEALDCCDRCVLYLVQKFVTN